MANISHILEFQKTISLSFIFFWSTTSFFFRTLYPLFALSPIIASFLSNKSGDTAAIGAKIHATNSFEDFLIARKKSIRSPMMTDTFVIRQSYFF
jgi:hypothetical protein